MSKKQADLKVVESDQKSDGRRQRSQRSRQKILEAMWALMLDGDMDPSAADIAEKAGVGLRSVFRHFEDMDDNYTKGLDAIVDCLLLSRCNLLIKTPSQLSAWSKVFNLDLKLVLMGQPYKRSHN